MDHGLQIIELSGSPKRMGEHYGESCRTPATELYEIRLESAIRHAEQRGRKISVPRVLDAALQCLAPSQSYDPEVYEEFAGIARGAGLSPQQCFVLQGLTDLRDLLALGPPPEGEGCSSFVVAPDRASSGNVLLGQNWDLQTDNMPYVRLVHRRPDKDPETWSLTLTGCLTLIGINAEGVAVGNTNLETTDARIGVQYLSVLHSALRSRSAAAAVERIRNAPRCGGHYYYVGGPDGTATGVECSATRSALFQVRNGAFVHCNHALSPDVSVLEAGPPSVSSRHRQNRLEQLLAAHEELLSVDDIKRALSDHDGGEDRCICRHDFDEMSTNASVIMSPQTREIHACRAQPHVGRWITSAL